MPVSHLVLEVIVIFTFGCALPLIVAVVVGIIRIVLRVVFGRIGYGLELWHGITAIIPVGEGKALLRGFARREFRRAVLFIVRVISVLVVVLQVASVRGRPGWAFLEGSLKLPNRFDVETTKLLVVLNTGA